MESKIIWSVDALKHLEDIHFFILFESKSTIIADKVIDKIFESTAVLKNNSEIYKLDKLKTNNDGTFRTYFVYDFQISYRIGNNVIQILRVSTTLENQKT